MRDSWFWRGMSVLGLMVALGYVVAQFTRQVEPIRAQGGSLDVVTGNESDSHRLYVLDSTRNVLLVYGPTSRASGFSLLASRYIEQDFNATIGQEFKFRANGYPAEEMLREAQKAERSRATRGGGAR